VVARRFASCQRGVSGEEGNKLRISGIVTTACVYIGSLIGKNRDVSIATIGTKTVAFWDCKRDEERCLKSLFYRHRRLRLYSQYYRHE
jgi:hypothetical protein